MTGQATLGASISGSNESLAVGLGGGLTSGLILSGGEIATLNMTVNSSLLAAGVTFSSDGLIITDDVASSGNVFTVTGASDFTVPSISDVNVVFGGQGSQGGVITNGVLSSLNMTVTSTMSVGGVTFNTSGLVITENASARTFAMTGASSFSAGSLANVQVQLGSPASNGNAASTGLLIANGSLSNLDMTVNSTIAEAGVTLTADGLHMVYGATPGPGTYSLSGETAAAFPGLGSFSTTLGTAAHPSGLVIQGANLVSLGTTITSSLSIGGVTFNANHLAFDYTAASNLYQMTGTTGVVVAGIGGLQVTFGTSSQPNGLVIQNGSLVSLGAKVNGGFTVDGVGFTATGLAFDYTASPQSFQITGSAGVTVAGIAKLSVTFGTTEDPAGIKVVNGTLTNLDVAISGGFGVDGVTFASPADDPLQFDYIAVAQSYEVTGTAGVSIVGIGNISVTFGTRAHPLGILVQNGTLENLDVEVNSNLSVDGLTFIAKQLEFDYTASTQTYQLTGTAGVSIAGLGSLSVTFGTPSHPLGILVQNGTLENLDIEVNSNLTVDGVTFTTHNLEFDYTAYTQTFQLTGTAGVSIIGLGSLSVTFGTPAHPLGILVQNGTLENLDVSVTSDLFVDGLTFYTKDLDFDYTAYTQTFQLTGTAGVIIGGISNGSGGSSPGADSFSVTFGGPIDREGILVQNGTLESLDATINASFWVNGVEIYANNLEFAYLADDPATGAAAFEMAGTVGAALPGGIGYVQVTFGSHGDPGLVISHGDLVSFDMTIAASFGVGGLRFAKSNIQFTYTEASGRFTMTGDTSFVISIGVAAVDFDVAFGGNGTQGLVIQNGHLISFNMAVTSQLSIGGISFSQSQFVFTYHAAANGVPSEFIMTGDTTFVIPHVASFAADLGGPGTQGLVIENGGLESLTFSVNANADFLGLVASLDVTASFSANTETFAFGGKAGLSIDTGFLPSWVKLTLGLGSRWNLGSVGFNLSFDAYDISGGSVQFSVSILGVSVGAKFGFNGSVSIPMPNILNSLGNAISNGYKKVTKWLGFGYLENATVFYDPSGIVYRSGDPETTTDAGGGFKLDVPAGATGGFIVAYGGTDISTGQPNRLILVAPYDAAQVNPLTTLLADVMQSDSNLTEAQGIALIDQALALPLSFDFTQEDYIAGAQAGSDLAAAAFGADVKITSSVNMAAGLLGGLPGAPTASSIGLDYFAGLASAIVERRWQCRQPLRRLGRPVAAPGYGRGGRIGTRRRPGVRRGPDHRRGQSGDRRDACQRDLGLPGSGGPVPDPGRSDHRTAIDPGRRRLHGHRRSRR